jgi:hypothetical protein
MNQVSFDDSEFKKGFASKLKDVKWISDDDFIDDYAQRVEGWINLPWHGKRKVVVGRHLQGNGRTTNPFTYVYYVEIDGVHAYRWGVDEKEMDASIDWFQSICSDARLEQRRKEDSAIELWEKEF